MYVQWLTADEFSSYPLFPDPGGDAPVIESRRSESFEEYTYGGVFDRSSSIYGNEAIVEGTQGVIAFQIRPPEIVIPMGTTRSFASISTRTSKGSMPLTNNDYLFPTSHFHKGYLCKYFI